MGPDFVLQTEQRCELRLMTLTSNFTQYKDHFKCLFLSYILCRINCLHLIKRVRARFLLYIASYQKNMTFVVTFFLASFNIN